MIFAVLFVCTGNICRSPVGERLFRFRADASAPVSAFSAGTAALVGRGIDEPSALALRALGVDSDGHVAQRLTGDHVRAADLVLTAQSTHRSTIVRAEPLSFRKTFTMREFGRLGADLAALDDGPPTAERLRARVAEVADQRGWVDPPEPGADDIDDPFGASIDVARTTAGAVSAAVDAIVAPLGLASRR